MGRFDSFFDSAPAVAAVFNRNLKLVKLNSALAELCGITGDNWVGKSLPEVAPDFGASIQPLLEEVLFVDKPIHRDITTEPIIRGGHTQHWHAVVFSSGDFEVGFLGIEITERKRVEETLQRLNLQLESTLAEKQQGVLINEMAHLLQAARVVQEVYNIVAGYMPRLVPNSSGQFCMLNFSKHVVEVLSSWGTGPESETVFPPDDCWSLREGRAYLVNDPQSGLTCAHIFPNLEQAELCVPLMAQYETLGILHLSKPRTPEQELPFTNSEVSLVEAVAQQIALPLANVKMRELLREQALRDSLSGLYNRRYFEEALDHEIRRAVRKQSSVGLMMVDVDHFKRLNDSNGHNAGDALLRSVAALLQSRLRAADVVCRYGGDEFAVIMPEASLDDTLKKAEELRLSTKSLGVTISIGVAAFPRDGSSPDTLIQEADTALYAAKAAGRDHVKSREWPGLDDLKSQESA
jgi:diguanylate cyclase (GGDEF)-like protein/PAS domain S-box-containing protein